MDGGLDGDQGLARELGRTRRGAAREGPGRRLSTFFFRTRGAGHRAPRGAARRGSVVLYLGSLAVLFSQRSGRWIPFTGEIVHESTFDNFRTLSRSRRLPARHLRTVGIAAAVTVTDAVLAFPIAYYMARVASPRTRGCSSSRS